MIGSPPDPYGERNKIGGPPTFRRTFFTLPDPAIPRVGMAALPHPPGKRTPAVDGQPHMPVC